MSTIKDRLDALHAQLAADRLTGFVVPLTDEHMSEYVGEYAQRLAWLTGFGGSAGSAAVIGGKAAIFTDGRYTLQVREQVPGDLFEYQDVPKTSAAQWLADHAQKGDRIGYDPWLHTGAWVRSTTQLLAAQGRRAGRRHRQPHRPHLARPAAAERRAAGSPCRCRPPGKPAPTSAPQIAKWLGTRNCSAVVIAALDSIAWLLNIRGRDVSRTPVALAFAILHDDASVDLFTAPEKITPEVKAHLGAGRPHPPARRLRGLR